MLYNVPASISISACAIQCSKALIAFGMYLASVSSVLATEQEALLKSAFVYNFIKFTEWPASAFGSETQPVGLCVHSHTETLDAMRGLEGKPAGNRTIRVIPINEPDFTTCHVVYVHSQANAWPANEQQQLKGKPVLTIGNGRDFARTDGIIGLYTEDNRIRFNINVDIARLANLQISSQLLGLAGTVYMGTE